MGPQIVKRGQSGRVRCISSPSYRRFGIIDESRRMMAQVRTLENGLVAEDTAARGATSDLIALAHRARDGDTDATRSLLREIVPAVRRTCKESWGASTPTSKTPSRNRWSRSCKRFRAIDSMETSRWIDYDGSLDELEVYLSSNDVRPSTPLLTHVGFDFSTSLGRDVYLGLSASTGGSRTTTIWLGKRGSSRHLSPSAAERGRSLFYRCSTH